MKPILSTLFLSIYILIAANNSVAATSLEIKNAWISQAPPVSKVLAAYMTINNDTDKTVTIESITSTDFSKVEFHKTIHEDGIAKMRQQKVLQIPSGSTLELKPGSYHLMLFNPVRKLIAGDHSVFVVHTNNDSKLEIIIPVVRATNDDNHNNHHHH